jgi:hypothetical protein
MAEAIADITIKGVMDPEAVKALAKAMESAHRRDLVGGLIRYLKDGETDFARLLFHYVHAEDYGQAMIEGWGELHKLITEPSRTIGPFGLSYRQFDFWEQAVMSNVGGWDGDAPPDVRERIIEAATRVKIFNMGNLLKDFERQEIEMMTGGFAAAGGLTDLIEAPAADEPDDDLFYEEDDDREGAALDSTF